MFKHLVIHICKGHQEGGKKQTISTANVFELVPSRDNFLHHKWADLLAPKAIDDNFSTICV